MHMVNSRSGIALESLFERQVYLQSQLPDGSRGSRILGRPSLIGDTLLEPQPTT